MDENKTQEAQKDYFLPVSIIVAAVLISGAWIYSSGVKNASPNNDNGNAARNTEQVIPNDTINIKPVSAGDHIRGNPEAPVKIVEFLDLECPFCKRFHTTMMRILAEYQGKVAWVYRHYPLDALHPKARKSAAAAECAGEQGGDEKFWAYVDKYFEVTPSNNQIDLAKLPEIAQMVGLDRGKFEECLASGKFDNLIADQIKDAENSGGRGTPYSVVIGEGGKKYPIEGALPYEDVKQFVDAALR